MGSLEGAREYQSSRASVGKSSNNKVLVGSISSRALVYTQQSASEHEQKQKSTVGALVGIGRMATAYAVWASAMATECV